MNDFNNIRTWLSSTVKNRYNFATMQWLEVGKIAKGYHDTYETLRTSLKDKMTREEYLEWVSVWRATYAKITDESRMAKVMRSTTVIASINQAAPESILNNASYNQTLVGRLKQMSNHLLDLREMSKEIAENAYIREKEAA